MTISIDRVVIFIVSHRSCRFLNGNVYQNVGFFSQYQSYIAIFCWFDNQIIDFYYFFLISGILGITKIGDDVVIIVFFIFECSFFFICVGICEYVKVSCPSTLLLRFSNKMSYKFSITRLFRVIFIEILGTADDI